MWQEEGVRLLKGKERDTFVILLQVGVMTGTCLPLGALGVGGLSKETTRCPDQSLPENAN